jgi:tetratricopeptide (TPR) repeat protein
MKRLFLSATLFAALLASGGVSAQLKTPSLSPNAKISQDFSISNIEISYSRPSMRGRQIMDDVIPYDKVWRTGANAPTKMKFGEDLEIAGQRLKAGEYSVYTIPGRDKWEIIFSTATGNWSADGFPKEYDAARIKIKPIVMSEDVQTFTIAITDITFTSCKIEIMWERTKLVLPVVADNKTVVADNIDKAINNTNVPYFQAASYYYETNQKNDVALNYVNKAIEQNPKAFYMWHLKAKIEKRAGNNESAIASAKKSIELATGTPNELEYKRNNEKIINELNKQKRGMQPAD